MYLSLRYLYLGREGRRQQVISLLIELMLWRFPVIYLSLSAIQIAEVFGPSIPDFLAIAKRSC